MGVNAAAGRYVAVTSEQPEGGTAGDVAPLHNKTHGTLLLVMYFELVVDNTR